MSAPPNRTGRAGTVLAHLCTLVALLALAASAHAQIAFRGAASAGVASIGGISHVGAGGSATRNNCGSINPSIPGGVNGDLLIALVNARESGASVTMTGWNQIYTDTYPGQEFQVFLFWRFATGGDPDTVTQSGTCSSIGAQIARFSGVDPTVPFENAPIPAGNVVRQNSGDIDTGTEATTLAGSMLLVAAFVNDNRTVAEGAGWSESFDSSLNVSRDLALSLHYQLQASAGPASISNWDLSGGGNDENYGIIFALRPAPGFAINVPAGTVANDVMIATIAARPCSGSSGGACTTSIAAPAGWTLVNSFDQTTGGGTGGYGNLHYVYVRVATGAEPASYAWTIGGAPVNAGATGGIVSFSGVDTTSPIVAEGGQVTPNAYTHTAPSIDTGAVANTMLVSSHSANSAATWSPGVMTEAVDVASLGVPDALGISLEMNYQTQAAAGATGTRTATHSNPPASDTGAAHLLALRPASVINHLSISHSGNGIACADETITITAHNAAHAPVSAGGLTVALSTTNGKGTWTGIVAGGGVLSDPVPGDGAATYTFAAGSSSVQLSFRYANLAATSETFGFNVSGGGFAETSGTADASDDPSITFAQAGFRFRNVTDGDTTIPTQISGKPSDVGWNSKTLRVQAIRTDTQTGSCVGLFASQTRTVELGAECNNPTACAAQQVSINGGAIATSNDNGGTGAAAYTGVSLSFNASSEADTVIAYPDAGRISMHARYDLDPPVAGFEMLGASNTFVVRPFGFRISGVPSGVTGPTSAVFRRAGQNFDVTLTAMAWKTGDDSDADGVPDSQAQISGNAATPNFGLESTPATATVSHTLAEPAGGAAGALTNTLFSGFSAGARTQTMTYSEVGIADLFATTANYLASGENVTAGAAGLAGVGRFIPDHFALSAGTLTNRSASACAPAASFTYMNEPLRLEFTLTAQNVANATTTNYRGAFARLDPAAPGSFAFGARDVASGTNLTARVDTALGTSGAWGNGVASAVQATLAVTRRGPDDPDGPFSQVKIGIAPSDPDAVALPGAGLDFSTTGGANDRAQVGADTQIRFGRLRLTSAFGSELAALAVPMQVEYWNGTGFLPNTADSCTTIPRAAITLSNYQGNLAACETAFAAATIGFASGAAAPQLAAPGAGNGGSVDLRVNLGAASGNACNAIGGPGPLATSAARSYLWGRWNSADNDGNPLTNYDDDPVARASFGLYGIDRVPNQFIYRRENY